MTMDATLILTTISGIVVIFATFALTRRFLRKSFQKTLLDKDTKYPLKLVGKKILNHDTRIFRFELPSKDHILGLPIGQHIYTSATVNGSLVIRPYTPISSDDDIGFMELLIKVYFKGVHPKFPEGGKMTQHLENLKTGDTLDVRGPNGLMVYEGNGTFKIQPKKNQPAKECKYKNLCLIAGGSGITPMYQMVKHILKSEGDETKMWLIFANQSEDDILLREELDDLSKTHAGRFKVWYTIDKPNPGWMYGTGYINAEMISGHFCKPGDDVLVAMCGPPPMIQFACQPALDQLGYIQDQRFVF